MNKVGTDLDENKETSRSVSEDQVTELGNFGELEEGDEETEDRGTER